SWERAVKWSRRRPAVAALLALIFLVSASGFAGITWQWQRAEKAVGDRNLNLYFTNVALAEREWSANNMVRADLLLDACPQERRGWEWYYVRHLRYGNLEPFRRHTGAVYSVAFSPDNRLIASGGEDNTVMVWHARTGKWLRTIADHEDPIRGV